MDRSNMSELRFEAPLAKFDTDEWNEFADENSPTSPCSVSKMSEASSSTHSEGRYIKSGGLCIEGTTDDDFENENISGSLEDLVNSFDSRIVRCLKNFNEHSDIIAPVQNRTDQDLLVDSQTWWTLTGNYGNVYPIDWSRSGVVVAGMDEQGIMDSGVVEDRSEDGWKEGDDEEEEDEVEFHAPINADDVINELDDLLEDHNLTSENREHRRAFVSRILSSDHLRLTKKFREGRGNFDDSELRKQKLGHLLKTRDDLNRNILSQSEVLIRELDERDELEYEKELKNQFIWLLITVQKRRKELLLHRSNRSSLITSITTDVINMDGGGGGGGGRGGVTMGEGGLMVGGGDSDCNNNIDNDNKTELMRYINDNNNNENIMNNNNNNNNIVGSDNLNDNTNNKINEYVTNTTSLTTIVNNNNNNNTIYTNTTINKKQAYLTTVIPYRKQHAPISIDILLIFIRILSAMNENSSVTPSLLTDYILNILCPAA